MRELAPTLAILVKLDKRVRFAFPNETPLEDVLKFLKAATAGPGDTGIPIYVDPVGLQEAEKTMSSPVTLDLDGVPLKTCLRLILKQLGLAFQVKDGLVTITSEPGDRRRRGMPAKRPMGRFVLDADAGARAMIGARRDRP